ncbi:hypothetical protein [Tautonia plasticadhaerens]|uniref:hypothetical protein n=1 Tax=Tautonia plasticadhaerens TaxID=2527974 RepID=UPI0011A0BD06|nr:hypothetical protein [Tautonia plasticadhaerens]
MRSLIEGLGLGDRVRLLGQRSTDRLERLFFEPHTFGPLIEAARSAVLAESSLHAYCERIGSLYDELQGRLRRGSRRPGRLPLPS